MKPKTTILLILVAALVATTVVFAVRIRNINNDAVTYAFLSDLADYADEKRRLPDSWVDFRAWTASKGSHRWDSESLSQEMDIKWGVPLAGISENDVVISAKNKTLKDKQKGWNAYLVRRLRALAYQ